jgi:PadR family transcriptional regulator, regulatory protein PadR
MAKTLEGCPCCGATLDKLVQPAVLIVLARGPLHGYLILERLAELRIWRGHKPDATGVYRALKAMQQRGIVKSSWDAPEAGPAKRLFSLTADGRRCMALWVATLDDYRDGIAEIVMLLRDAAKSAPAAKPCGCAAGGKTARKKAGLV